MQRTSGNVSRENENTEIRFNKIENILEQSSNSIRNYFRRRKIDIASINLNDNPLIKAIQDSYPMDKIHALMKNFSSIPKKKRITKLDIEIVKMELELNQQFLKILDTNNVESLKHFIEKESINLNFFKNNNNPLMYAIKHGKSLSIIEHLLQHNIEINFHELGGSSPLAETVILNNKVAFNLLIKKGADVNHLNYSKETPLLYLVKNDFITPYYLLKFIECNVNLDLKDNEELSVLMQLTKNNESALVDLLLNQVIYSNNLIVTLINLGKNKLSVNNEELINLIDKGYSKITIDTIDKRLNTPLMYACQGGSSRIVRTLLKYKANINQSNIGGNRPLFFACYSNDYNIAKILLDTGKVEMNHRNNYGDTELSLSCINDNAELINLLIDHHSNVNTINNKDQYPVHIASINDKLETLKALYSRGANINAENLIGNQCFSMACINENIRIMDYLLTCNIDYNHTTYSGDSALHQSCILQKLNIVKYLLKLDRIEIDKPNSYGFTPLLIAAKKNNFELVKILLEQQNKPIDINAKSNGGDFPLFYATYHKNVDMIKLLLEHNADIYNERGYRRYRSYTVFLVACSGFGNVDNIMKLFIDYGIDVNRPNSIGIYPIALACESGNIEQVRLLLNHGANPNVQSDGSTPLIQSCINNNSEVVKLLIEHGADVNFVNSEGLHPLLFLVNESESENCNLIQYLIDHGANIYCKDNYGNSLLYIVKNSNKVDKEEVYKTLINAYKKRNDYQEHCQDTTSFIETYDIYCRVIAELDLITNKTLESPSKQELSTSTSASASASASTSVSTSASTSASASASASASTEQQQQQGNEEIRIEMEPETAVTGTTSGVETGINIEEETQKSIIKLSSLNIKLIQEKFTKEELERAYLEACILGKFHIVKILLENFLCININVRETNGDTPLIISCQTGKSNIALYLLEKGADPNLICECGSTALYVATFSYGRHESMELMKSLLDHGSDPNILCQYCLTPLMVAAKDRLENVTKLFLSYGANPNIQDTEGNSALSMACARGNRRIVELLLQSPNINIDLPTKGNYTPLMAACNIQEYMIAVKLIEAGASLYFKNDYGQTAVQLASNACFNEVLSVIFKLPHKVDLLQEDDQGFTPYHMIKLNGIKNQYKTSVNIIEYEIDYLNMAIQCYECKSQSDLPKEATYYLSPEAIENFDTTLPEHPTIIEDLKCKLEYIKNEKIYTEDYVKFMKLNQTGELNLKNLTKDEINHLFLYSCIHLEVKIIYQMLALDASNSSSSSSSSSLSSSTSDFHLDVNTQDQDGNTALHYLCGNKRYETDFVLQLLKTLIKRPDININIQNQHGYTPLMIACYRNSEDIAKILINHEADVNKRNIYNETALMMACQYRSHLLVKLLLEKGAEVDVQNDKRGETALIIISNYYYSLDILKLLVVQGKANVNLVNKKGESPLILSCLTNNIEHINILVSHGADINIQEKIKGQTPLMIVLNNFNYHLAEYLLSQQQPTTLQINLRNYEGETALIAACRLYNKYGSELLIEHHADTTIKDNKGQTAKSIIVKNNFEFIHGL